MRHVLLAGLVLGAFLVGPGPAAAQSGVPAPVITQIFGPETPTGPYKHPACLTELSSRTWRDALDTAGRGTASA